MVAGGTEYSVVSGALHEDEDGFSAVADWNDIVTGSPIFVGQ